jgi:hypothetical protein
VPQTAVNPPATLPGISFAVVPPAPAQVLPRMDIAGFVGFAASGPLQVPVAVQDATQFEAVFGADVPIAWDTIHNEQAYGLLGPAVRAFFRNGGQRCWIVRVADQTLAQRDRFELPGVAAVDAYGNIGLATLDAASCGSWADEITVTAALDSVPLEVSQFQFDQMTFTAGIPPGSQLGLGDLVRLQFPTQGATLYAVVSSLTSALNSPPAAGTTAAVRLGPYLWVEQAQPAPGTAVDISYLGSDGAPVQAAATVAAGSPPDGLSRLAFDPALSQAPIPGALVRGITEAGANVVLDVSATEAVADGISTIDGTVWLVGPAPALSPVPEPADLGERLTLSLTVTGAAAAPISENGLGFAPAAAQFLGGLPADEAFYADSSPGWPARTNFPLAGPDAPAAWYIPLGLTAAPSDALGAMYPSTTALERDGLSQFGADLFLDPALAAEPTSTLLQTAGWVRDQSPNARPLQGIHALLDNDEVTLLATPDAVQRGWESAQVSPAPSPAPPVPVPEPDWASFLDCSTRVLQAPQFPATLSSPAGFTGGVIHLTWTPTDAEDATYELQQASDPDWADATDVYLGSALQFDLSAPPPGSTAYVRVRAAAGGLQSAWSPGLLIQLAGSERWFLNDPGATPGYSPDALLAVQSATLRMCAAQGDLLAILAMPEHYRTPDALAHVAALKATGSAPGSGPDPIFGFGALYHPWLYCSDPNDPTIFRRTPPDGPAAGVAAQRAFNRGAWIAPANEALDDVLALDQPVLLSDYQALANAQINFVRDDPGGFLWLAADTLSDEADVRPINVRRLLALLRRTAEDYGTAHVFEPNNDVSRRTARRSFQNLLGYMYSGGAFAGTTPAEGFQVSTPVAADDLDQGRLVVELRVAPSLPLVFLTVLLVQSGTGTLQVTTR